MTLRARWVTLGALWVTLRARWVTPQLYSVPPGSTVSPYMLNIPPPPKRSAEDVDPGQYWRFADTNKRARPGARDQPPPLEGDPACRVFIRYVTARPHPPFATLVRLSLAQCRVSLRVSGITSSGNI